jgi:hypothetical protein
MTMPAAPAPKPHLGLRIALIVLAAIEMLSALNEFTGIFYEYNHTTKLLIVAQGLTTLRLALAPLFAGVALWFAIVGRIRHAIVALAILVLFTWVTDTPSFAIHGLEWSASPLGLHVFAQKFLYPLFAIAAIVLAAKNRRLWLAGVLVSLPTLITWFGILAFTISVLIYGF